MGSCGSHGSQLTYATDGRLVSVVSAEIVLDRLDEPINLGTLSL
jgi:hypothetical protein